MGAATAYFLALSGKMDPAQILVVEKDSTYALSSTTLSAASTRQRFSTPESIQLSQFGLTFLKGMGESLRVPQDDVAPDAQFREGGYLYLADESNIATRKAVPCWDGRPGHFGLDFPCILLRWS